VKRYEYQTKVFDAQGFWSGGKIDVDEFDATLNEMGSQGWQLIEKVTSNMELGRTRHFICTFMREIH